MRRLGRFSLSVRRNRRYASHRTRTLSFNSEKPIPVNRATSNITRKPCLRRFSPPAPKISSAGSLSRSDLTSQAPWRSPEASPTTTMILFACMTTLLSHRPRLQSLADHGGDLQGSKPFFSAHGRAASGIDRLQKRRDLLGQRVSLFHFDRLPSNVLPATASFRLVIDLGALLIVINGNVRIGLKKANLALALQRNAA